MVFASPLAEFLVVDFAPLQADWPFPADVGALRRSILASHEPLDGLIVLGSFAEFLTSRFILFRSLTSELEFQAPPPHMTWTRSRSTLPRRSRQGFDERQMPF